MPWLSIIMAVITFLLSGGLKKGNAGKAAAAAIGVGAGTYYVTHETDWGRDNLGFLDGVEVKPDGTTGETTISTGIKDPGTVIRQPSGSGSSGANGLWNTLGSWLTSPAGQVTTGAAAGKALGVPNWLLWGGVLVGGYLLLKD